MKKIYSLSLLFLTTLGFAQTTDSFTGTGILTDNGWVKHSGATAGQLMIVATSSDSGNSLFKTGLAASTGNRTTVLSTDSEDANKELTTPITTTAYFSVLVKALNTTSLQANTASGDYTLCLGATAGATGVSAFSGRIYTRTGSVTDTVNFGILNNSGGTATPTYLATDFPINQTVFLVVKYDIATNTASLWANPTPGAVEPAAGATNVTGTTAAPSQIASIVIRQGSGTGNVEIDEIRVGDNWAFVTPAGTASTKNFDTIAGLSLYPNPVSGNVLNISSTANSAMNVAIFDILGKQVINTKVNNNTVNISSLHAGVYIVKVTEDGKTATRKLVVR
tara:strand:- start:372 stop:1379 length:1008 start_codon:yes stop_codon:yes gene_type:complete